MGSRNRRSADEKGTLNALHELGMVGLKVHVPWSIGMVCLIVASLVRVNVKHGGVTSLDFRLTSLTVAFAALVWLPALLRTLVVAGGSIKTPAGEASTRGLLELLGELDPETKLRTHPAVLAALTSPEALLGGESRREVREIRKALELQYAFARPSTGGIREQLDEYAREYERLRAEVPPGRDRTMKMTTVTAEARAVARVAPLATANLRHLLESDSEGDRVIGLSLAQDQPNPRLFDLVVEAVEQSRSAFEQYHAMGAAYEMLPLLDGEQRRALKAVIETALRDEERAIGSDASRSRLAEAILSELG